MSREKQIEQLATDILKDFAFSYSIVDKETLERRFHHENREFASEIFWEIDKLLTRIITDDENGTQFIGVDMQKYYALKKKYTEERT